MVTRMGNFWKSFCEVDPKFPKCKELHNFCKKNSIIVLKKTYVQTIPETISQILGPEIGHSNSTLKMYGKSTFIGKKLQFCFKWQTKTTLDRSFFNINTPIKIMGTSIFFSQLVIFKILSIFSVCNYTNHVYPPYYYSIRIF